MKVISFRILNWKLLINISDETVFTFKNALETAEAAKPKSSVSLAKPLETLAFPEANN